LLSLLVGSATPGVPSEWPWFDLTVRNRTLGL
jgi:hypothetical protein